MPQLCSIMFLEIVIGRPIAPAFGFYCLLLLDLDIPNWFGRLRRDDWAFVNELCFMLNK